MSMKLFHTLVLGSKISHTPILYPINSWTSKKDRRQERFLAKREEIKSRKVLNINKGSWQRRKKSRKVLDIGKKEKREGLLISLRRKLRNRIRESPWYVPMWITIGGHTLGCLMESNHASSNPRLVSLFSYMYSSFLHYCFYVWLQSTRWFWILGFGLNVINH